MLALMPVDVVVQMVARQSGGADVLVAQSGRRDPSGWNVEAFDEAGDRT